jgi:hypothetical protein
VRRRREARSVQDLRVLLAQQAAEQVEHPADAVVAAVEGGREPRFPEAVVRDRHVDQRIEAVVPQDLRVGHGDHVDAEEHPHQVLVDEVVHRAERLRCRVAEVQVHLLTVAGQLHRQLVRAVATAVVTDVVTERQRLPVGEQRRQQQLHRLVVAFQQGVQRGQVHVDTETLAQFGHPAGRRGARGHQAVQVGPVPLRHPDLVEDDAQGHVVQLAVVVQLERRDYHTLLVDGVRVGRHRTGCLAADVGHVAEHRRPADHPAVVVDRDDDQPVVGVADRGAAGVRVGGQQDVALADRTVEVVQEVRHRQAELADHHLAARVGDQRELVVLFADARGQRGAEQHLVHLVAGVAQRVLDDVQGDRVDVDLRHRLGRGLEYLGHQSSTGRISRLPLGCTVAA